MDKEVEFYDLYWHDSILKEIHVDRNQPGDIDTIILRIKWRDNHVENEVAFKNVWWANLELNFGFHGVETIYEASMLTNDDADFKRVKELIGRPSIYKKLKCYNIKTNSDIKIVAEEFILK